MARVLSSEYRIISNYLRKMHARATLTLGAVDASGSSAARRVRTVTARPKAIWDYLCADGTNHSARPATNRYRRAIAEFGK